MGIRQVHVSPAELETVVATIQDSVMGVENTKVLMACLAIAISLQVKHLNEDTLVKGIKGASEWIALYANSVDEPVEKKDMN